MCLALLKILFTITIYNTKMLMNEPKWIKASLDYEEEIPFLKGVPTTAPPDNEKKISFLKGVPIKAIENSSMQWY